MAGVSKVVYGSRTLVDLTSDTVSADKMASGATAHAANGDQVTGTIRAWAKMGVDANGDTRPYWHVEGA